MGYKEKRVFAQDLAVIKSLAQSLKTNERFHGSLEAQVDTIITKLSEIEGDISSYDTERENLRKERENLTKEREDWIAGRETERAAPYESKAAHGEFAAPNRPGDNGVVSNKNKPENTTGVRETSRPSDLNSRLAGGELKTDVMSQGDVADTDKAKANLGEVRLNANTDNKKELDKLANRELPQTDIDVVTDTTSPIVTDERKLDNNLEKDRATVDPKTAELLETFKDK